MLSSSAHVRIRKAQQPDAKALAAVFRQSWETTYRGVIPHGHLQGMIAKRSQAWWEGATRDGDAILVIEVCDTLAGYASFGPARGAVKAEGEIYELYLTPVHQGLGLGELLFEAARGELEQQRLDGLIVWALADNEPALAFYWRRGGRPVAQTIERLGGARLAKIGFTWQ